MKRSDLEDMARWLEQEDLCVREFSAATLDSIGFSLQLRAEALASRLDHEDAAIRERAARALGEMGADLASPHTTEICRHLDSSDLALRRLVLEGLMHVGEAAALHAPIVAQQLRHPDSSVRRSASATLIAFGTAAASEVAIVACEVHNSDPRLRMWAALSLGDLGDLGMEHAGSLVQVVLNDHHQGVRQLASQSLAKLHARNHIDDLLSHLTSCNAALRRCSFEACQHLGTEAGHHAVVITSGVWDPDAGIRLLAAKGLGSLGEAAAPQAAKLEDCLRKGETRDQRYAAAALAWMGQTGAGALRCIVNDKRCDDTIREFAKLTLETMGAVAT